MTRLLGTDNTIAVGNDISANIFIAENTPHSRAIGKNASAFIINMSEYPYAIGYGIANPFPFL